MSAKRDTYLAIKKQLEEKTSIKHVLLYNSQFQNMDREKSFEFPCVFVEFLQLAWSPKTRGVQEAEATIRLHVGFENLMREELHKFDVIDNEVHKWIEGLEGCNFGKLTRVNEEQDINHDNVYVWIIDYAVIITDESGARIGRLQSTNVTDFPINVDTTTELSKPHLKHKVIE